MNFWYEVSDRLHTTIDYGRYEAVTRIDLPNQRGCRLWSPVLAGPVEPKQFYQLLCAEVARDFDDDDYLYK